MSKKNIFILLLFTASYTFAQKQVVKNKSEYDEKALHFGYTLGINQMDFTFKRAYYPNPGDSNSYSADLGGKMLGFQVGMITDFRLGEYFNLRILPSFNFGQRNLLFTHTVNGRLTTDEPLKIESSMLDLPVLIKYKAMRINNYRPYLIAGASVRYDLASKKTYIAQDPNGTSQKDPILIMLTPLDVYAEMGFGIDYYFPYFKFSTEIKLSQGFLDVLNHTTTDAPKIQYNKSLLKLNSNIIMLSFHFE